MLLSVLYGSILPTIANAQSFNAYDGSMILCDPVYSRDSIPNAFQDGLISIAIQTYSSTGSITLSVFRFEDRAVFEKSSTSASICYRSQVNSGGCQASDLNKFILSNETLSSLSAPILNEGVVWDTNHQSLKFK